MCFACAGQESSQCQWLCLTWSARPLWAVTSSLWTGLVSLHQSKTWGLSDYRYISPWPYYSMVAKKIITSPRLLSSPVFKVRRYEVIRLGVTYETEVDCDLSGGLRYTWTLFDSAGEVFPLPLIDTHRQSLVLPSHLLHYDTYTAIARVSSSCTGS